MIPPSPKDMQLILAVIICTCGIIVLGRYDTAWTLICGVVLLSFGLPLLVNSTESA